jgi:hypothetical protein
MSSDDNDEFTEETWEPGAEGRWTQDYGKWASGISLDDFHAYLEIHKYIFAPTRAPWPAVSVNSVLPDVPLFKPDGSPKLDKKGNHIHLPPALWLDQNRTVAQLTWCPGLPMLVRDRIVSDGGWIERHGVTTFNLYRPPPRSGQGDSTQAGRWLELVHRVFPDEAIHIISWLAHRVQQPQEKINHALVLGGKQGIGKDSILEPAKRAVGHWNFREISPSHLLGRFNGFGKAVILRISEGRDLGEVNRFVFYDRTKIYAAAPPDVLRIDEKHLHEYDIFNCLGLIITTNHKTDGLYLPSDDRRHFVAWSNCEIDDVSKTYWDELWGWYENGGFGHVAAHLAAFDLSAFNPKAPPPKTPAFWAIADASRSPEDAELADILDDLGRLDVVTLAQLIGKATGEFQDWLMDRRNRRATPYRMERNGYAPVRNPDAADGLWKVRGRRQVVYGKASIPMTELIRKARKL